MGQLTSLTELNMNCCRRLEALPTFLGALTNLQLLDLGGCKQLSVSCDSLMETSGVEWEDLGEGKFKPLFEHDEGPGGMFTSFQGSQIFSLQPIIICCSIICQPVSLLGLTPLCTFQVTWCWCMAGTCFIVAEVCMHLHVWVQVITNVDLFSLCLDFIYIHFHHVCFYHRNVSSVST